MADCSNKLQDVPSVLQPLAADTDAVLPYAQHVPVAPTKELLRQVCFAHTFVGAPVRSVFSLAEALCLPTPPVALLTASRLPGCQCAARSCAPQTFASKT